MNAVRERGRIVRIESDRIWVESISRSACAQCAAKSVCGQSALARWAETANLLAIDAVPAGLAVGDTVEFEVGANALVKAALTVYMVPLLGLLAGALLAFFILPHDLVALAGAALGLLIGMKLVRLLTVKARREGGLALTLLSAPSLR